MSDEYSLVLDALDPRADLGEVAGEWALRMVCTLQRGHAAALGIGTLDPIRRPETEAVLGGVLESAPIGAAFALAGMQRRLLPPPTLTIFAVVAGVILARPEVLTEKPGQDAAIEAGRGLRLLVEGQGADLMRIRPHMTPGQVALHLRALDTAETDLPLFRRYMGAVGRLINLALEGPAPEVPKSGQPRPEPSPRPAQPAFEFGEMKRAAFPTRSPSCEVVPTVPLPKLPADDDGEDASVVVVPVPRTLPRLDGIGPIAKRSVLDRIQLRAVATQNQELQLADLKAFTPAAIGDFGTALRDAHTGTFREGVPLGISSLYAGASPATIAEWPVYATRPSFPVAGSYVCRQPLMLVVANRSADRLPSAPIESPDLYRVPQSHAFLPLNRSWNGINTLARAIESHADGQPLAGEKQLDQLRHLVESRYRDNGTPATLRRLPTALPEALAQAGVGRVEMTLILGREASQGTFTSLCYYAPSRQRIAQLYLRGGDRMSEWLGKRVSSSAFELAELEGYLGARRCPTDAAVLAALEPLRTFDWSAPRGAPKNVLADYLRIQGLVYEASLWCTGVRPNDGALDGLLYADDFLLADEKRKPGLKATESSARALPLSSTLRELIPMWLGHRRWTIDQLGFRGELPVFFSVQGGMPVRLTPDEIRAPVRARGLSANAPRHYFRTELEARGADPVAINAWMGHWRLGDEPGRTWSGRAPASVSNTDRQALEAHSQFLNFPIPTRSHRSHVR